MTRPQDHEEVLDLSKNLYTVLMACDWKHLKNDMLLKCLYRTLIVTNFKCNLCLHLIILWMIAIWTCLKMLHDTEASTLNSLCQHRFLTSFSLWLKVNSNICLTPCCIFLVYASPCCTCIVFVSPCCTVEPSTWCMFLHDAPSWLTFLHAAPS